MTDYKLVPVEPTPEMVEAAADAYMPFGDMELALRMAILTAPAPVERNQCDGCQAGIPVENGMHRMGKPGMYPDLMLCTADRHSAPQPAAPTVQGEPVAWLAGEVCGGDASHNTVNVALDNPAPWSALSGRTWWGGLSSRSATHDQKRQYRGGSWSNTKHDGKQTPAEHSPRDRGRLR